MTSRQVRRYAERKERKSAANVEAATARLARLKAMRKARGSLSLNPGGFTLVRNFTGAVRRGSKRVADKHEYMGRTAVLNTEDLGGVFYAVVYKHYTRGIKRRVFSARPGAG